MVHLILWQVKPVSMGIWCQLQESKCRCQQWFKTRSGSLDNFQQILVKEPDSGSLWVVSGVEGGYWWFLVSVLWNTDGQSLGLGGLYLIQMQLDGSHMESVWCDWGCEDWVDWVGQLMDQTDSNAMELKKWGWAGRMVDWWFGLRRKIFYSER